MFLCFAQKHPYVSETGNKETTGKDYQIGRDITMDDSTRFVAGIQIGDRHRKDMGDIAGLAASIKRVGLLHPVVIRPDGLLVAGARRLEAVKSLGWIKVPVHVVTNLEDAALLLAAERDENDQRKEMTVSEKVALGKALEPLEREAAAKRRGSHLNRGKDSPVREIFPNGDFGPTAEKVGEAIDMSGRTYLKAKAVVEAAEQDPDTFGPVLAEMDRTGKVDPAYQKVKQPGPEAEEEESEGSDMGSSNGPTDAPRHKPRGKGVDLAHEAINCLRRIPKNDRLRDRGFQIVTDWIRRERRQK
jgi:ParB family chromosome partitioning protein